MKSMALRFTNSFACLPDNFFVRTDPEPLDDCHLIDLNNKVADFLGLNSGFCQSAYFVDYLNGQQKHPEFDPLAAVYAGHQFGHYVPQLGDGRAILLGEITTDANQTWELQSKGSGLTQFSRSGDGRAVLRSTIREYLCSTAMDGLGIPSTHALCMMASSTDVYRERVEKAALLIRIAPSFVRFGSFEYFHYQSRPDLVKILADYVIKQQYPAFFGKVNSYFLFFQEVIRSTAELIAKWQAVGFAHGVMNTDNMSILGLTLDFGPFGFLDEYNPDYICNHSDHSGRYAFKRQATIGLWNLHRLAEALCSIIPMQQAIDALADYEKIFSRHFFQLMGEKLGLKERDKEVLTIINQLLSLLESNRVDYTVFFRSLASFDQAAGSSNLLIRNQFTDRDAFDAWAEKYQRQLVKESSDNRTRALLMNLHNPKYILRNYLAQIVIEKAERGDYSVISILQKLLQNPFDEHLEHEEYAQTPPDWAKEIVISCSS